LNKFISIEEIIESCYFNQWAESYEEFYFVSNDCIFMKRTWRIHFGTQFSKILNKKKIIGCMLHTEIFLQLELTTHNSVSKFLAFLVFFLLNFYPKINLNFFCANFFLHILDLLFIAYENLHIWEVRHTIFLLIFLIEKRFILERWKKFYFWSLKIAILHSIGFLVENLNIIHLNKLTKGVAWLDLIKINFFLKILALFWKGVFNP